MKNILGHGPWWWLLLVLTIGQKAGAQEIAAPADLPKDQFEFMGRASTNIQMFQRALLPGPAGAIVDQQFMAPIHTSLSARAVGIDTPVGKDSLQIQVAAFGQLVPGADDAVRPATWDVSSAFIEQRWKSVGLTLGRQVVAGGAARYSRLDGAQLAVRSPHFELAGYGGLTVMPRWNQQYGYHHLGDGYEDWSTNPEASRNVERLDQWMAGARARMFHSKVGSAGVSIHQQAEQGSLYRSTLGLEGSLTAVPRLDLNVDALFNTDSRRFSDVRLAAMVQAWDHPQGGLTIRGEFLHTLPSALLSQSSVLSVFSYEEISEAGGEVALGLPGNVTLEASGYAQMMNEGSPGLRTQLGARLKYGELHPLMARLVVGRLKSEENGYFTVRSSLSYVLSQTVTLLADLYFYRYDQLIADVRFSSFYAAHVAYQASRRWSARIGSSLTQSPYARFDLQALAKVTYEFDVRGQ